MIWIPTVSLIALGILTRMLEKAMLVHLNSAFRPSHNGLPKSPADTSIWVQHCFCIDVTCILYINQHRQQFIRQRYREGWNIAFAHNAIHNTSRRAGRCYYVRVEFLVRIDKPRR